MKKLFDETHEHETGDFRTIWYGYISETPDTELQNKLLTIIKEDLTKEKKHVNTVTHWVFYHEKTSGDAIGDTVRAAFMVREKDCKFVANYTMSDFYFVISFDALNQFKVDMEARLNQK